MAAMRDVIHALDDEQPIESLGKMSSLISSTIAEPLFHVRLVDARLGVRAAARGDRHLWGARATS